MENFLNSINSRHRNKSRCWKEHLRNCSKNYSKIVFSIENGKNEPKTLIKMDSQRNSKPENGIGHFYTNFC